MDYWIVALRECSFFLNSLRFPGRVAMPYVFYPKRRWSTRKKKSQNKIQNKQSSSCAYTGEWWFSGCGRRDFELVFPVLLSAGLDNRRSLMWLTVGIAFSFQSCCDMFWKQQQQQRQQLFKQQRVHAFETAPAATASCECFSFLFSLSVSFAGDIRCACVFVWALLICVHCFISTTTHIHRAHFTCARSRIHATDRSLCVNADSPQIQCNTHSLSTTSWMSARMCAAFL